MHLRANYSSLGVQLNEAMSREETLRQQLVASEEALRQELVTRKRGTYAVESETGAGDM